MADVDANAGGSDVYQGKSAPAVAGTRGAMPGLPAVRAATWDDLKAALMAGWEDLKATPVLSLGVGAVCALAGNAIFWMLDAGAMAALAWPAMAGFALVAPFAAVLCYEISRRREQGQTVETSELMAVVRASASSQVLFQGFLTLFWLTFWLHIAWVLWAVFFGVQFSRFWDVAGDLFTTTHGLAFLVVGHASGLFFAVVAFAMSAVTFPYLLDRDADCATAMVVSFKTVFASPVVMGGWAALIAALLIAGSLPFLLGLVVVLPLLGHASWHLYRRLVGA
ncbi:MAG: DUF2189 domain-containing protein [Pseudomonadota bacterium]